MEEQPSTSGGLKCSIPQKLQQEIDEIAANATRVTTESSDLDNNQKIWLVVGICLHSILSPALRKYVVPILTVLYNESTLRQKIDTQTYPTHLKKYPPTNTFLNYEAVNNNKATYGYQNAMYDYTIRSVVDVSKLFLQTHMAYYTSFDETCDSTALLALIINIDKFPHVVKLDAENVRRNIRNPWAHCDFTEWDAVKYANSFQLMEKLIKELNLSSSEEQEIIGEMQKWKRNGQQFLSGTTLGLELVNDIRQHTHVLAEYTQMVAIETDRSSIRIKNVLENYDIILNRLRELEKDVDNAFSDMNKRLLSKQENYDTLFA